MVIVIAVGMIYGFWMGCAITAGGTVIGEYVCFAVIRALFLDRAQKFVHLSFFFIEARN